MWRFGRRVTIGVKGGATGASLATSRFLREGYVLLSDPEPVLRNVLEQIGTWQETEDREATGA